MEIAPAPELPTFETARLVLRPRSVTLGLKQIIADVDPGNAASIGVATKLGFQPLGSVQHENWAMTRYMLESA